MEQIYIGCDHAGFALKRALMERLAERGLGYKDCGCYSPDSVRYPVYGMPVARAVASGEARRGILVCGTGIGMSIMANKLRGVRASLCTSAVMGRLTRAHNDSNILVLAGKLTGEWEALAILDAWLDTPFDGGRHAESIGLFDGEGS